MFIPSKTKILRFFVILTEITKQFSNHNFLKVNWGNPGLTWFELVKM